MKLLALLLSEQYPKCIYRIFDTLFHCDNVMLVHIYAMLYYYVKQSAVSENWTLVVGLTLFISIIYEECVCLSLTLEIYIFLFTHPIVFHHNFYYCYATFQVNLWLKCSMCVCHQAYLSSVEYVIYVKTYVFLHINKRGDKSSLVQLLLLMQPPHFFFHLTIQGLWQHN